MQSTPEPMAADPFVVHDEYQEDFPARVEKESEEQNMADSLSESGSYDESDEDVDDSVVEDMKKLEDSFRGISKRFRLINRIGEGMRLSQCRPPTGCRVQGH